LECVICRRTFKMIGQDFVRFISDRPVCEDCWNELSYDEKNRFEKNNKNVYCSVCGKYILEKEQDTMTFIKGNPICKECLNEIKY